VALISRATQRGKEEDFQLGYGEEIVDQPSSGNFRRKGDPVEGRCPDRKCALVRVDGAREKRKGPAIRMNTLRRTETNLKWKKASSTKRKRQGGGTFQSK